MLGSWNWSLAVLAGLVFTSQSVIGDYNTITPDDQLDGPKIEPSESEILLQNGQNYTLKCKGKLPLQFKQQDVPEVVVGPFTMEQRSVPTNDGYEIELVLNNVDKFTVGYYACFDNFVNINEVLNNISEEPTDTAHISYIYIYVNGSESLIAPMREIVMPKSNSKILIECKPTAPDINVTLTSDIEDEITLTNKYNPKIGFTFDHDLLSGSKTLTEFTCGFKRREYWEFKDIYVNPYVGTAPSPVVSEGSQWFLEGETFTLNCSVVYQKNSAVMLTWDYPGKGGNIVLETNERSATDGQLFTTIHVVNATSPDAGKYKCLSTSGGDGAGRSVTVEKNILEHPFIKLVPYTKKPIVTRQKKIRMQTSVESYPPVELTAFRNGKIIQKDSPKFILDYNRNLGSASLTILNTSIFDTGNYTIEAKNKYLSENITFDVRPLTAPVVDFGPDSDKVFVRGHKATLVCRALGNPLPKITWRFTSPYNDNTTVDGVTVAKSNFETESYLEVPVHTSRNVTCIASNDIKNSSSTRKFLVYDVEGGFGIVKRHLTWFWENQKVTIDCVGSIYNYDNVTWLHHAANYSRKLYSHDAKLTMEHITMDDSGLYTCVGIKKDGTRTTETINITVEAIKPPSVIDPVGDKDLEVFPFQPVTMFCLASAIPPPTIDWFKDGQPLSNSSNIELIINSLNQTTVNASIEIRQTQEEDKGKYECFVRSEGQGESRFFNVILKGKTTPLIYLSIIGVIVVVLIILVVYLAWKIRKEKRFRKELAAAGLLYFKEGVTKSLNPDLGINDQAELLPYDDKFEFPAEKLKLGKQLGAGAFGVVYRAEVRGIVNAEETTTVAVKMVKKTADNMYIKALASELKIMVHLGKHINIVNLLGACTKNVGKRELIVIVEYCKFGNIHNYMQKHREVFIDQLTDNKEKNTGRLNRGFSSSSGNSGMHSDYFGSNHTQETDNTFLTNRSGRKEAQSPKVMELIKVSETGYVQQDLRSTYESDYSFDGRSPRPLYSRDLLAWAFQVARGMEYLANRKVLHGDLAARNILLAEDMVVKICDFGLARSIYKNDEYQKQENSPLPVKWLAIECMTDRIFSTQSDVWSFGIVLWEIFSLAKTPYPNISHTSLLQYLSEGHRLEKPSYADDRIYDVMLKCWSQKPTSRPSFGQLQETIGTFLEDNVRNHYVDLNSSFMDANARQIGVEDYLAMVSAPDYNNLVTPSPHHYVNDGKSSFFPNTPTPLLHDDEGYLQMSPAANQTLFSPRAQDNKFDFDARKLNPRGLEPGCLGSELTPMLTLNNLPTRSGSESDHEGNSSSYLHMCPRIEEESDEVFELKQKNLKNALNTAVSNPTYIAYGAKQEKPNDIHNIYINANNLVK